MLGYFGEDIKAAIGLMDRSLELNPSFAHGWRWSGWIRLYAGQADLAIEHFQTSLRLSPRDRTAGRLTGIGIAHFFNRRFDDAAATLLVSLEELPAHATPYRFLASCYAHMGSSTTRERSSGGCAPLPPSWCPVPPLTETQSSASYSCRACAWRPARKHEPDPSARGDPCRRCGGVFAADGGG